jgi:hypothetical protein
MTAPDAIRPALSRAETDLLLGLLDRAIVAASTLDQMEPLTALSDRLRSAALRQGWREDSTAAPAEPDPDAELARCSSCAGLLRAAPEPWCLRKDRHGTW